MKTNEKIIAAFLVSLGLFTANYAAKYVSSLSDNEKTSLFTLASGNTENITVCDSSPEVSKTQVAETRGKAA